MPEKEQTMCVEGLQLKILNNTNEEMVLLAQKIEKGKHKKGCKAPEKIEPYEEKNMDLIACEGSCEGGTDIEGWVKYGIGCSEGYCKIHFKYIGKLNKGTYSCESHLPEGKMSYELQKDKKNDKIVTLIIGPKK